MRRSRITSLLLSSALLLFGGGARAAFARSEGYAVTGTVSGNASPPLEHSLTILHQPLPPAP